MKKVIIDGVEYRAVTPETKEEKRREFWIEYREDDGYAVNEDECGKQLSGPREIFHVVAIKENEIIVSEDKAGEVLSKYVDSCWLDDCMAEFGFKKDGV